MQAAYSAFAGAIGGTLPFALALVIIVLLLKTKFGALIDRVRSFSIAGQKAELAEPQQLQVEQSRQGVPPAPAQGLREPGPADPVIAESEQEMRRNLSLAAPGNVEVQLAWAIRMATSVALDRDMEVTYRVIFGSQIAAVKDANLRGGSISVRRAEEIYDRAKARFPEVHSSRTFEEWAEFLLIRGLFTRPAEPIEPDTVSHLTDRGRQFLHFLTAKGLSEERYG